MTGVRVSVAMVTYNGEKYIREQLDSILRNLTDEDELVISDDGSADGTWDILEEYAQSDERIFLYHGPCEGIIANVENALLQCRGEYIYLSDQDDVWMEDKIPAIQHMFEHKETHLIVHDSKVCNGDLTEIIEPSFFAFRDCGEGAAKNFIKNTYIGCCMAFRRELLEDVFPIPRKIQMHDQWIGLMNDIYYNDTMFIPHKLLLYRRHDGNASDFNRNSLWRMIRNRMILLGCLLKHQRNRKKRGKEQDNN